MKIVVDRNIPYVVSAFQQFGEVVPLPPREITADTVRDAEVIVIRSETTVDRGMLENTRVKIVGTSTIGTDHIDSGYLSERGISLVNAPGSNANSVAEYVVAALLRLAMETGQTLKGKTLGVVGIGNIGSNVVRYAEALGMLVLQTDPPLARSTGNPIFVPLDELMSADVISLHVPLTKSGADRTYHLFDHDRISRMQPGAMLINTARGSVVETRAVTHALERKHLRAAVLDVWENEPEIDVNLLRLVTIGTAHVAGYSLDGKVNAVKMVYDGICHQLSKEPSWDQRKNLSEAEVSRVTVEVRNNSDEEVLHDVIRRCYDIKHDDDQLRSLPEVPEQARSEYFGRLRTAYRVRREFPNTEVVLSSASGELYRTLGVLGFNVRVEERQS